MISKSNSKISNCSLIASLCGSREAKKVHAMNARMNLERRADIEALHRRALVVVERYKSSEAELIKILTELDLQKGFRDLGFPSIFAYATQGLKLAEGTAYHFIQVARKSHEVPELTQAIETGELNVGNARRIAPILTQDNKTEWIEKAKTLPRARLERELATHFPQMPKAEKVTYTSATRADIQVNVSEEVVEMVKRVQDLLSQRKAKTVSLEEALKEVLSEYVERNDPLKKTTKTRPGTSKAGVKREVNLRDQGQCTATLPNGERCNQRRWLHQHHKVHRFDGGKDTPENLATLCHAHHRAEHTSLH